MSRAADRRRLAVLAVVALLAAATGLGNGFVYDDLPIIFENPLVHRLAGAAEVWTTGYWPAGLLYRPLAVQLFALQWAVGGGNPLAFHIVNTVLALAAALLFWRLAERLLPAWPAWCAALLFAVHPVHVEVVANAVGQTELLASALALLVVERYLTWRTAGALSLGKRAGLAALTFLAIHAKETGYVIPALLLAGELLIVRKSIGPRWRLRDAAAPLGLQAAAVVGAVLLRIAVLGPTPAAGPAVALRDLPAADRIIGMLAIVPEWVRLLVWPAHLQAEYGPPALEVTGTLGPMHLLGAAILLAALGTALAARQSAPVVVFGLIWVTAALLPVSNLLTVTGVIVAERTLFLPSAGAVLAIVAIWVALADGALAGRRTARHAAAAAWGGLVLLGLIRSMERQRVWRSSDVFFDRLVHDAPRTYRAHLVASIHFLHAGRTEDAERAARRVLDLYRGDPHPFEHLGQLLRRARRCEEAVPILDEAVRRFPDRTTARSRLIECILELGDTARAVRIAEAAVAAGYPGFEPTIRRLAKPR